MCEPLCVGAGAGGEMAGSTLCVYLSRRERKPGDFAKPIRKQADDAGAGMN